MREFIYRHLARQLDVYRQIFPAVAILGPRQCGKSTFVKQISKNWRDAVYLDLQSPADFNKLNDPLLFFESNADKIVFLDEIQLKPELFSVLRSAIDGRRTNGRFILLGSASRDLVQKSSETLAGRIGYLYLTPFLATELNDRMDFNLNAYWYRGGFPLSYLAQNDEFSAIWREQFVQTFVERDLPQLGISIPAMQMRRFITLCAHLQGQTINLSKLGEVLGLTHPTIRRYVDLVEQTFIARTIQPFEGNLKKRLVKSPKLYLRDTGLLHALLGINSFNDLLGHPVVGHSWETLVIEHISTALPDWGAFFYRTSKGDELDFVLSRGNRLIAVECKSSSVPQLTRGTYRCMEDLNPEHTYVIAPMVAESYPLAKNITVCSLFDFLNRLTR